MKRLLLLFSCVFIIQFSINAQSIISGRIVDNTQMGIPGVSILEKGTTNGSISNFDGEFQLQVKSNESVLIISYLGYVTQEVKVGTSKELNIQLEEDLKALEEVVVIGYGEVEKSDVTGSVSTLGEKEFIQGVTTNPQDLLTGKIAGVNITRNSGAPGAGSTIRIRGGSSLGGATNDPLIVIDGFPVDDGDVAGLSNPLSTLNPNDIESFSVLKDASATAIYGSRASNGVILITTKKANSNQMKVNFDNIVSVSTPTKFVNTLTGDEYRDLITELHEGGFSGIDERAIRKLGDANTNWQDEIFSNAVSYTTNLSVSGKVKNVPYRVSYGFNDENGILKTTNTNRHTLSVNVNPTFFKDHLSVNVNAKGTTANTNFGETSAIGNAIRFDPTQPVYADSEKYRGYFAYTQDVLEDGSIDPNGAPNTFVSNPVAMLDLTDNRASVNRFVGNAQLDYKLHFLEDLHANLNVGIDRTSTVGHDNVLPGASWTMGNNVAGDQGGSRSNYTTDTESTLLEFFLNYKKSLGKHNIDLIGGYSWQRWLRVGNNYSRNYDETLVYNDNGWANENYLISFYGRMIYSFDKRYVLTATLRNDGSSRFAKGNQWGLFPSLAFAWNVHNESFLADVDQISTLKLRLGYGITGQQGLNVGDPYYPAIPNYRRSIEGAYYQFGNEYYHTLRPSAYDSNLKWEETTTYNIGLDFGLWDDKLSGSLEGYTRTTNDLLNRIPIADGSNFSNYLVTNVGSMEIKGIEFSLTGRVITKKDFTWSVGGNITYNHREITKLNKVNDPNSLGVPTGAIGGQGNLVQIHSVGYAPNSFFVYQQIYDTDGKPIEGLYVNRSGENGEVISNEFNKYRFGNPNPDVLIGINTRLNYKKFDFSMSGRLSLGNYVYNYGLASNSLSSLYYQTANGYFSNIRPEALDIGFINPQYWSDIYVQDASFFRMDNISMGYSFSQMFNTKLSGRASFTVNNAFVITNYEGVDPEVGNGIDGSVYPIPRVYQFGLNLNF
ncbi:TonB-dependent receptor [Flammeovirga sp. OC4]|uniref:SusC/RagA family TonB-linked outer membrane protein n=1 Tax=Flammeovirga sp. OC4 TaxID=1382345 RepID=UPI0005C5AB47|nr:TonB-dependent receptor [Flammeovirga sp. OC4]